MDALIKYWLPVYTNKCVVGKDTLKEKAGQWPHSSVRIKVALEDITKIYEVVLLTDDSEFPHATPAQFFLRAEYGRLEPLFGDYFNFTHNAAE